MFAGADKFAVRLAMFAVVLELTVSANLLTMLGIPYVSDGGSLFCKLHPGTYLLILSFALRIIQRGSWLMIGSQKTLTAGLGLLVACLFYSLFMTGPANLVVLLDTFLPAGLLAFILSKGQSGDLQQLRSLMQMLIVTSATLALAETAAQVTLIPLYLNDSPYHPHGEDFRPTALFDHPLTGSVMTMLGLALTPQCRWCKLPYAGLMWAAMLAYGGRVAIGTTLLMAFSFEAARTGGAVLRRRRQAADRVIAAGLVVTGALLLMVTATSVGLGTRLAGHLYWDDSAQVRLAQWQLLDHLSSWQVLFGISRGDLLALLVPLRLGTGVEVIENFWLLMFVSLGLSGFPIFLGAFLSLIVWCWRRSQLQGRALLLGVLLVASTSNSIGRKSTILVCLVSAIASMPSRPRARVKRRDLLVETHRLVAA